MYFLLSRILLYPANKFIKILIKSSFTFSHGKKSHYLSPIPSESYVI
jgi:hypothetical protein